MYLHKKLSMYVIFACTQLAGAPRLACTVVPVTDLIGEPIQNFAHNKDLDAAYSNIPLAGCKPTLFVACPRMHQLIFNEVVEIVEERGKEVKITIPHCYYMVEGSTKQYASYWTLKKNLVAFDELTKKGLDTNAVPTPIDYHSHSIPTSSTIITLQLPWYNPELRTTFSAGTRFVLQPNSTSKDGYAAYVFDKDRCTFTVAKIPKKLCLIQAQSQYDKIKQFVQLLRTWTEYDSGFIPYVWGGCSFTNRSHAKKITTVQQTTDDGKPMAFYAFDDYTAPVKTGFDCTSLVTRAAQLCGIPYFLKNSIAVANHLAPITTAAQLAEGDIIWIPKHVMVVSSVDKNMLIEARHYMQGYGKVQEIPLNRVFKGINTYQELCAHYFNKKPLQRLDVAGVVKDTFPEFKLLKLASVWQ